MSMRFDAVAFLESLYGGGATVVLPVAECEFPDLMPDDLAGRWQTKFREGQAKWLRSGLPFEHAEAKAFFEVLRRMTSAEAE